MSWCKSNYQTVRTAQDGTFWCHWNLQVMNAERPAWNVYKATCPTRQVLNCIADKWSVLVVGSLMERSRRTGELKRGIEGISQKMLTQTLRALERDGLVRRDVFPRVPPRVDYSLTPLGTSLGQIIDQLRRWAEGNIEEVLKSQHAFDNGTTDQV